MSSFNVILPATVMHIDSPRPFPKSSYAEMLAIAEETRAAILRGAAAPPGEKPIRADAYVKVPKIRNKHCWQQQRVEKYKQEREQAMSSADLPVVNTENTVPPTDNCGGTVVET